LHNVYFELPKCLSPPFQDLTNTFEKVTLNPWMINYEWWLKNRAQGRHDIWRYHFVICVEGLMIPKKSLQKTVKMNIWNGHLLNMKITISHCNIPYIKYIKFLLFYIINSYFSGITNRLNKNLGRHANNCKLSSLFCNLFITASYHSTANNKCKLNGSSSTSSYVNEEVLQNTFLLLNKTCSMMK
jgi:hypothetical protein